LIALFFEPSSPIKLMPGGKGLGKSRKRSPLIRMTRTF
jgi:hypothetical protein